MICSWISIVGGFPGAGLLGVALEFGGTALGAKASEDEMEEIKRIIQELGQESAVLGQSLEQGFDDMKAGLHEIKRDWEEVKADFKQTFAEVKDETKALVTETKAIKDIALHTQLMVEQLRYKVSIF